MRLARSAGWVAGWVSMARTAAAIAWTSAKSMSSRIVQQKMAINDPSLKPLADGLRFTDTDPIGGQFGFDPYKLADVVTPQIVNNVWRQFPVGPDWMYQY